MIFKPQRASLSASDQTLHAPLQAATPASWLNQEQGYLLSRVLIWIGRMLVMGLGVMLGLALVLPFAWQRWLMLILLGLCVALHRIALILNRRGQVFRSSILTIGMVIVIGLVVSLLFKDMHVPFVVISVMLVSLASTLIGARAGLRLVLILAMLDAFLVWYITQFRATQFENQLVGQLNANVGIYLAAMLLSVLLVKLKDESVHRALNQWMFKSRQLEAANLRLQKSMDERALAEEQRVALAVEQERVRILTNFVRDASHEFRTPLSVINANLYLLNKTATSEMDNARLDMIGKQTAYLNHLIEALMEMSRLDSGLILETSLVQVNDLTRDVVDAFQLTAERKQLTLRFQPAEVLPPLQGDRQRLELAISHLLQNALDYSEPGNIVEVMTLPGEDSVQIVVRDGGPGIGPDILPHIFERFYRGDQSRSTRGVGLGLPMALKIAEAHSGRIEVESTCGEGSIFRLILPAEAGQEARLA